MAHRGGNIDNEASWRRGPTGHTRDHGNEQSLTAPLPANGEFVGRWKRIDKSNALSILYGATAPYSFFIEWSQDGKVKDPNPFITITPGAVFANGLYITMSNLETFHGPWYRVRVKNEATPQAFAGAVITILPQPFPGHRIPVLGGIPLLGNGPLTLATQWGKNGAGWKALLVKETGEVDQPALEAKLQQVIDKLTQVFGAVDGLEFTAENVRLDAAQINLSTDQVEQKLDLVKQSIDLMRAGDTLAHMSDAGSFVVRATPGIISRVIINRYVTNAAVTLTLYDAATEAQKTPANVIGVIQVGLSIVGLAVPPPPMNLAYNGVLQRGLTAVLSAGGADITIGHRGSE